jgi:hypothetical protein
MSRDAHAVAEEWAAEFLERVSDAGEEPAARRAYAQGFERLRARLVNMAGSRPSLLFEAGAQIARELAAACLPLGIAVTMHLYPLCALRCIPVPMLSPAQVQRSLLLRAIGRRHLIVANAGSERTCGASAPLAATPDAKGVRIDGTCEYMSLASVADLVFFQARLAGDARFVLCAADLRADSVHIGRWKFTGRMRLSDTSSVTFVDHLVPHGRYVIASCEDRVQRIADYQRCWFHLFIAEVYLARMAHLRVKWNLAASSEHLISLNEMARLREYSLYLLDDFRGDSSIESLVKTTSALKLRASLMAHETIVALHDRASDAADAKTMHADADELRYIKSQPTSDDKILRGIGLTKIATSYIPVGRPINVPDKIATSYIPVGRVSTRQEPSL